MTLYASLLAIAVLTSGCVAPGNRNPVATVLLMVQTDAAKNTLPADGTRANLALLPATTGPRNQSSPPPLTTYLVGEGETLWLIAARKEIYGDALLWPLLYKANRDQIKDPSQIYPRQLLNIPRNLGENEKDAAREVARKSGIFPLSPPPVGSAPALRAPSH